jgi:polar amino acid transport system substrate-binding protein
MRHSLLLAIFLFCHSSYSKTKITIYSYHPDPPYIINENKKIGNTFKLLTFLNKNSNYEFSLEVIPRKRLDFNLKSQSNIIVPWTTPEWFKDKDKKKFKWSNSFIRSSDVLISNKKNPINGKNVEGLNLAGLRGGKWPLFAHLIRSGKLKKTDVPKYISILYMVNNEYVDGGVIPSMTLKYYKQQNLVSENIYVPKEPLSYNNLRFLVKGDKKLLKSINHLIEKIKKEKLFK